MSAPARSPRRSRLQLSSWSRKEKASRGDCLRKACSSRHSAASQPANLTEAEVQAAENLKRTGLAELREEKHQRKLAGEADDRSSGNIGYATHAKWWRRN
jgi:hypothetical protein